MSLTAAERAELAEFERAGALLASGALLTGSPPSAPTAPTGLRLWTISELAALPRGEFLVDGILPVGADAMLYGPPESFKSLLAIDLALSVATGHSWHGRSVLPAPVVYIAGEGRYGLAARFHAYQAHHGREVRGVFIVPEPLSLLSSTSAPSLLQALEAALPADASTRPLLLIVDTVRKCTPGGEENDSGMVSLALGTLDAIRRVYPLLTALLLHHPGRNGANPRGSSAWEADTDTVLKTEREGRALSVRLTCEKQRDAEPFEPLEFEILAVGEGLVVDAAPAWQVRDRRTLSSGERKVLQALDDQRPEAVSWSRWQAVAEVAPSSLSRQRRRLMDLGLVRSEGHGRTTRYAITGEGIAVLSTPLTSAELP